MAEKINLAPFNLVEREHKDTASRLLQSLVVSVKLSGGVYTPNYSLKQAVEAARKCYDVRLAVVGDDIDIPKIYHLTEIYRTISGKYAIRFVCGNDSIRWSETGMNNTGKVVNVKPHVGKIDDGDFYGILYVVDDHGVIRGYTYETNATAGVADELYLDVPTMQLYRFNPVSGEFVAIVAESPSNGEESSEDESSSPSSIAANPQLERVDGRLVAGNFFAVQDESNGVYTYKNASETPSAGVLYNDVTTNEAYIYDAGTESFVTVKTLAL